MKRMMLAAIVSAVPMSGFAQGMSPQWHPRDFCSIGAETGLPARPFNPMTGGCASNYVDVGTQPGTGGMVNNLAFYSMGRNSDSSKLMRVSFILNVNNAAESAASREALVKVAVIASRKILGGERPGLAEAIRAGSNSAWTNAMWRTEVTYENWPANRGHTIAVRFIPTGTEIHQY